MSVHSFEQTPLTPGENASDAFLYWTQLDYTLQFPHYPALISVGIDFHGLDRRDLASLRALQPILFPPLRARKILNLQGVQKGLRDRDSRGSKVERCAAR